MISMIINHDWCWCTWSEGIEEFCALQEACSYEVEGRWFSESYKNSQWDGKKNLFRMYSPTQGGFPSGIFKNVMVKLSFKELQISVQDMRTYPHHTDKVSEELTFTLRDYQEEAVKACLTHKRGVIRLPTAAGKTKAMVALMASLNLPTLWITHEGALARQSIGQIESGTNLEEEVGFYAGGDSKMIKRWTVALVQSLSINRESLQWWFDQIKVIILDECHRGASDSWNNVALSIPAPFRFGCSATPFERSDGSVLELMGVTGNVIYKREVDELKEHLSRPYVEMVRTPYMPIVASGWKEVYRKGIIDNKWRNNVIIDRAMRSVREKSACLIFVSRVEHGEMIRDALDAEIGINTFHTFISGSTPQQVRDETYAKLQSGELYIVIATDKVAGEGQDIPAVARIIIGGGLKSNIITKQRIGRGMRPSGNGEDGWGGRVDIHDFVDVCHPRLMAHSDLRKLNYEQVKAEIRETEGEFPDLRRCTTTV